MPGDGSLKAEGDGRQRRSHHHRLDVRPRNRGSIQCVVRLARLGRLKRRRKMTEPDPLRPLDYLDYAEQFHSAFHELKPQSPPLSWPRYFLLCHSIELALKAYLAMYDATPEQLKYDFGHKLDELVDEAVKKGLPLTTTTQEEIK